MLPVVSSYSGFHYSYNGCLDGSEILLAAQHHITVLVSLLGECRWLFSLFWFPTFMKRCLGVSESILPAQNPITIFMSLLAKRSVVVFSSQSGFHHCWNGCFGVSESISIAQDLITRVCVQKVGGFLKSVLIESYAFDGSKRLLPTAQNPLLCTTEDFYYCKIRTEIFGMQKVAWDRTK